VVYSAADRGFVTIGILGFEVGGLADGVDLDELRSRRRAARWLERTAGVGYGAAVEAVNDERLRRRFGQRGRR
jgi:hypothetical protein